MPILGAITEADANSVVSGKVDNEYFPDFGKDRAASIRMPKVYGMAEALEGRPLEKPVRPDL